MKESIHNRLIHLSEKRTEIGMLLTQAHVVEDQARFRELIKEYASLEPIVSCFHQYQQVEADKCSTEELLNEDDPEIQGLAKEELPQLQQQLGELEQQLHLLLLPSDDTDSCNAYLEIRAGAGGDEAGIFAGDLFRMYTRLAEREGWGIEIINTRPAEQGGLKEAVAKLTGKAVFKVMKFESGVHRVQRVPETESQGRIHTSTCTVAILPETEEIQDVNISKSDLRVDTYRASGAGGQHVNKTDSAVRLTHIPSGLVVECQDGRSQHKNKEKALSLLGAKLKQRELEEQQESIASERKVLVGTGDRSEKIRTYNFPQGRMTDHRIKLTQHNLDQIMDGDIKSICDALLSENQLAMLSQLEEE